MKNIAKYPEIENIISANNKIFIKGKEFYSDDIVFVSPDFELFNSDNIVYRYIDENLEIFDYNKGIFVKIYNNSNHIIQSSTDNNLSLIFDNSSDDTIVYDLQNYKTINIYDFGKDISIYYHNLVIVTEGFSYTNKNNVSCWDLNKLNILWSYTLPEGFKISSPTQIIDNLLFFDAFKNGNEEHFIVGLDINTGKIVWKHLYKIPYKEDIIAFTFSQKNKLCYAYLGNWYQIFNPISGEIIFEKKFDNDIDPYVNSVYDDKLWFVSGKYENCKFGYISLKTNEIELLQDFQICI